MFGLKDLLEQAQGLQRKISDLQEQLAQQTLVGSAGGDMVRVEVNGALEIVSVHIEKDLLSSEDSEVLEELIVAATNDALTKARNLARNELAKITYGIQLPGLL